MPKEGEDSLAAYAAIRELVELLKQGAHVVVSMPGDGQAKIISLQRTAEGKVEVKYET